MAKISKGRFSRAKVEEMQYLNIKARTEVQEVKNCRVDFPGYKRLNVARERHPVMLPQNDLDGFLLCKNGSAKNPLTSWRYKEAEAPSPEGRKQTTPEPAPPLPQTPPGPRRPPVPPSHNATAQ